MDRVFPLSISRTTFGELKPPPTPRPKESDASKVPLTTRVRELSGCEVEKLKYESGELSNNARLQSRSSDCLLRRNFMSEGESESAYLARNASYAAISFALIADSYSKRHSALRAVGAFVEPGYL